MGGGGGGKSHQPPYTLQIPPHSGYDCDSGGREPSPPPMSQLRHVGPTDGAQEAPPHYRPISEGGGTEALPDGRGKGMGGVCD